MCANRLGNFELEVRYVDKPRPTAKRLAVSECQLTFGSSREAWDCARNLRDSACSHWSIMIVSMVIREDGAAVWKL